VFGDIAKNFSLNDQNGNEFKKNNVKVVGINIAESDSQFSFCNKLKLNFPVLSDIFKQINKNLRH